MFFYNHIPRASQPGCPFAAALIFGMLAATLFVLPFTPTFYTVELEAFQQCVIAERI